MRLLVMTFKPNLRGASGEKLLQAFPPLAAVIFLIILLSEGYKI
jgi:hypothetical protein